MKAIVYRNPVKSAIFINTVSLVMYIYLVKNRNFIFSVFLVLIGIINKQIIDNGESLKRKKKIIIYISFFLMITTGFIYAMYVNRYK